MNITKADMLGIITFCAIVAALCGAAAAGWLPSSSERRCEALASVEAIAGACTP